MATHESTPDMLDRYITRDEFASTVESLGELIRDQTRSQGRAMTELRREISNSSRPQWQPLSLAFTVFSVVLSALYGVHLNGEGRVEALQARLQEEHLERLAVVESWQPVHDHEVRSINAQQDAQIEHLQGEVERLRQ